MAVEFWIKLWLLLFGGMVVMNVVVGRGLVRITNGEFYTVLVTWAALVSTSVTAVLWVLATFVAR